jgi:glutathione S-transferase
MNEELTLYHSPGACSRVTMNALEEIGVPYEDRPVDILAGEQRTPDYLAVNPKGKVPALRIGTHVLAENAAILYYLHTRYPQAALLPPSSDLPPNAGLEDLVWCSATVHVLVRQIRMPIRFTALAPEGVRSKGSDGLRPIVDHVAARVAGGWWYGERWSIVDVYLYWNYSTAASAGFELPAALVEHAQRVRERPAFQRALQRERLAVARHNIQLPPGAEL